MIPFREKTPCRRLQTTKNPSKENWSEHKPDLREDFNNMCGYCNSHDEYRHTYFEVDHFVPKSIFIKNGNIALTQYDNLVYSCKFCNNFKSAKWPSNDERIFNDGNVGFVDPCDTDYDNHFYRTLDGGIMWRTNLGKWMFSEAFKFDERQQGIKVLWNLNQLDKIINSLTLILNSLSFESEEYINMKNKIGHFCFDYFKYHKELIKFYNNG